MKKSNKKVQTKSQKVEIEDDDILPTDEILDESETENQDDEYTEPSEIESDIDIPEEDDTELIEDDDEEEIAEPEPQPKKIILKPASEAPPEITNKQKKKALQRAIDNKNYSIEKETIKIRDWRVQAKDRDEKAENEYQKRKTELEESLRKNEERYQKRMAKTKRWWWEFCTNHEDTKIKKMNDDLALLQKELDALVEKEPEETK